MGVWCLKMPLLSTLAALIIIVHSFDEGMEEEYHHGVSPRLSDPDSVEYDQSWKTVELPLIPVESVPADQGDDITPQEPPRRRRPGRKRKRRLQDEVSDGRKAFQDETPPDEITDFEVAEMPKRRRKKPEDKNNRWDDEPQETRSFVRRRGHRRKRPVTPQPDDQFDEFAIVDRQKEIREERVQDHEWPDVSSDEHPRDYRSKVESDIGKLVIMKSDDPDSDTKDMKSFSEFSDEIIEHRNAKKTIPAEDQQGNGPYLDGLNEYYQESSTEKNSHHKLINIMEAKIKEKLQKPTLILHNHKEGMPIDVMTLKALLKQSNGGSLSEILQQRNLSLADLLNGRENAISALQRETAEYNVQEENKASSPAESHRDSSEHEVLGDFDKNTKKSSENLNLEIPLEVMENDSVLPTSIDNQQYVVTDESQLEKKKQKKDVENVNENYTSTISSTTTTTESSVRIMTNRRRFPAGARRKQRIRGSPRNNTLPRSHNFVSSHPGRRTILNRDNVTTTPKETDIIVPIDVIDMNTEINYEEIKTTPNFPETVNLTNVNESKNLDISDIFAFENVIPENEHNQTDDPTTTNEIFTTDVPMEILQTEKTEAIIPHKRHKLTAINQEQRRQSLTNGLKRKRLKQKNITEDGELDVKELFGMPHIVSASEFVAKTHKPDASVPTVEDEIEIMTTIDDVTITEHKTKNEIPLTNKISTYSTGKSTNLPKIPLNEVTEGAKFEIEEILNDSNSARLSKILSERNMTVNELLEHRERGSSKVHLADIFHNTSKEPNPPEPFLSKSLIEPISKEIYPLRALLEANLHEHDPSAKVQSQLADNNQDANIPIVMDFGNNVNENGENLGIVSLFNKFHNKLAIDKKIKTDSEGTPYFTSVQDVKPSNDSSREGRNMVGVSEDNSMIGLDEMFTSLNDKYQKEKDSEGKKQNSEPMKGANQTEASNENEGGEDVDGDGLVVLEDIQHINDFDNNIAQMANEKLEIKMSDDDDVDAETTTNAGLLEKIPSSTKSVTIATAAIAGLTLMLFLLTYIGCKWRNQRRSLRKNDNVKGERIPTPVFETRKLSKINSSNRSISPMLSTSNIYTMSTLESSNGKESPDYMWDSLRKPFQ